MRKPTTASIRHATMKPVLARTGPSAVNNMLLFFALVLILCCGLSADLTASDAQQRFAQGNQLMSETRYAESLTEFRAILESGEQSGALYLNMAIAATRLDSLGLARVYFHKASDFAETARAGREGYEFVTDQLDRRGAQLPELGWMSFQRTLLFDTNYTIWLILGVLLLNIGVVVFIFSWLRERYQRVNRKFGLGLTVIGLLVVIASISFTIHSNRYEQGVQIVREVQVHQLPDNDSDVVLTGYEGFRYVISVRESKPEEGWLRVRMVNGSQGWVSTQAVYRYR